MKAKLFKTLALGALAWIFLAPTKIEAQVANPLPVVNNTPCKIDIRYEFYRKNPQTSQCEIICGGGGMSIPPSPPVITIPTPATCGSACGVKIYVVAVNSVPVSPPIIAGFNVVPAVPSSAFGPDPSGCSPSGIIKLNVSGGMVQLTP